jgi:hypothetical protein
VGNQADLTARLQQMEPYYDKLAKLGEAGLGKSAEAQALKDTLIGLSRSNDGAISFEQYINWPKGVAYHQTADVTGEDIYHRMTEQPAAVENTQAAKAAEQVVAGKTKGAVEAAGNVKVKKGGKVWDLQDWNTKIKSGAVENGGLTEKILPAKFDADLKVFQNNWDELFSDHLPHDTGKIVNGLEDKISRSLFDHPGLQSKFDKIMNDTHLSQDQKLERVVDLLPIDSLNVEERLMLGGKYIEDPKVFASVSEDGYVYTIARKGSHALRILNAGTGKLDFSSSSLQGDLYLLGSDGRIGRMKP